jgi:hypothetical protein
VTPRPPPPPVPAPHHRSHHQPAQVSTRLLGTRKAAANLQVSVVNAWFLIVSAPYVARGCLQVCGQQGAVLVAYGGGCGGVGAPVAPWPFLAPYPPLQWQVSGRTRPLRPPSFSSQNFLSLFSSRRVRDFRPSRSRPVSRAAAGSRAQCSLLRRGPSTTKALHPRSGASAAPACSCRAPTSTSTSTSRRTNLRPKVTQPRYSAVSCRSWPPSRVTAPTQILGEFT